MGTDVTCAHRIIGENISRDLEDYRQLIGVRPRTQTTCVNWFGEPCHAVAGPGAGACRGSGADRSITDLHPDDWDAHFQQDLPNYNLNWGVDVFGDQWGRYFRFNEIETRKIEPYVNPFVEWKPRPDWSLRFELDNVTQRGFKRTLEHFAGPRGRSQVAFTEDKDPHFGQLYYVRLRKTFG